MRLLIWVTLIAAASLAGYLLVGPGRDAPQYSATHEIAPALPKDESRRLVLTPNQRREAAGAGGFVHTPQSLLRVDRQMRYGDYLWSDEGVAPGPITIRIDLRTQLLSVFRGGHEIGIAVVLYGADSKETPVGQFPIQWKGKNHRSSLYDAPMPYTLRLTGDGVAIHGSEVRWGAATHGCIGVPTDFARNLFAETKVGDPVVILRSAPAA